jgi:hypothetical protein
MTVTDALTRRQMPTIVLRNELETLAEEYRTAQVGPIRVTVTLLRLRNGLRLVERRMWWAELVNAIQARVDLSHGCTDWSTVPGDLADLEVWADWTNGRIDEALTALTGGAR